MRLDRLYYKSMIIKFTLNNNNNNLFIQKRSLEYQFVLKLYNIKS